MSTTDLRLRDSVVYFAQRATDGAVKVGRTTALRPRLARLRSAEGCDITLLGTVPGDGQVERQMHRRLVDDCLGGEWFRPSERVLAAATGELNGGDDSDPFFYAKPSSSPGLARQATGKSSRDELRRKITLARQSGLTGREAAHMLGLSTAKLTREVKLMSEQGYF